MTSSPSALVLYFIMSGNEPYSDLEDEEVERRFMDLQFPESRHLGCGAVIQDCWLGHLVTAEQVVKALDCFIELID
jgi:hypothetical protein